MRASAWIGLAIGVATGLWMWAEYALGLHTNRADLGRLTGFASIVFPIVGLIWVLRRARSKEGRLSFRSGLPHMLVACATATVSMVAMSAVYVHWIHPQWLEQAGITASQFLLQSAMAALVGGCIVGLIALAFLRTPSRP